jgi:hypothetical protein
MSYLESFLELFFWSRFQVLVYLQPPAFGRDKISSSPSARLALISALRADRRASRWCHDDFLLFFIKKMFF